MKRFTLVIVIFFWCVLNNSAESVDWMPDSALRSAVREEFGLPTATPLTKAHMQEFDSFYANNKGISNIKGLELTTNLRELDLSQNPITDLRPLANLTTLKGLYLSDIFPSTPTLDLRPLANLINLEELTLENSKISDISPLGRLKKLQILHLSHNYISNLRPLLGLRELRKLRIRGNPIGDLTPLSELNLTHLR